MKKMISMLVSFLLLVTLCACAAPADPLTGGADKTEPQNTEEADPGSGETEIEPDPVDPPQVDTEKTEPQDTDPLPQENEAVLTGKIITADGGTLLLACEEEGLFLTELKDLCLLDEDGREISADELRAGMNVTLTYSGIFLETYPAQPAGASTLRVTSVEQDLVGFYMQVIADLYAVDPGLNGNISMLAFDLSQTGNLSEREKEALVYLAGVGYELETTVGTFEELCEAGLIDAENLWFEDGILINITVTEINKNSFTFHAEKWRSGLGAYFFYDCKAKYRKGEWSYTIGAEAIS